MKNNGFKNFKNYLTFGSTRQGNIAVVTVVIVVAIVILLNLLVGQLPETVRKFDFSNQDIYDISETSEKYIAGLDKDVSILLLTATETDKRIVKYVENYAEMSDHLFVSKINVMENPSALTKFECDADSMVVCCEETGKYTVVPYVGSSDAIILTKSGYDASYNVVTNESAFDCEGQLTSAIDYVTGGVSETVYTLTGHGETDMSANIKELIEKSNIGLSETPVDLLKDGMIPEDCSLLLCHNPSVDLADDELEILKDYLKEGNDVFIILNDSALENFNALLLDYGLQMEEGYIGDQANYLQQYASSYGYFFYYPSYFTESTITENIKTNALIMYPRGMTLTKPVRSGISVEPFLLTSENGIRFVDETNASAGQFVNGAVATENTGDDSSSRLTVITSLSFVDEGLTKQFSGAANLDIFMNAFTANFDGVENFAIEAKSLEVTYNYITNFAFFSIMFIFIIPLALIIGGLVFWRKRRSL